ncbi:hypothetical protein CHISP_2504 [Chitinispirillum alkaliphilum]|nr:hypothetical protein CHISP_2504 [Chitinispirillum alkaliphilum]
MLCVEVFTEGEKRFNKEQMALLKKVPYSVNRGENMIILPEMEKHCAVHNLPCHSGSHTKYNDLVSGKMDGVKDALEKMKTKPCDGETLPTDNVLAQLTKLENKFWKWHVNKGKNSTKSVSDHAKDDLDAEKNKKRRNK